MVRSIWSCCLHFPLFEINLGAKMFFFKRHIKQGEEIGNLINLLLRSTVTGTSLDRNRNVYSSLPTEFFIDSYVGGFIHSYVGNAIHLGLGGANWSSQKKGECVYRALEVVDPTGTLNQSLIGQTPRDQDLYVQGGNDGTTVMGVVYGVLRPDDPDPKVADAHKLSDKLVATGSASSAKEALALAVAIVTLREYIFGKWG